MNEQFRSYLTKPNLIFVGSLALGLLFLSSFHVVTYEMDRPAPGVAIINKEGFHFKAPFISLDEVVRISNLQRENLIFDPKMDYLVGKLIEKDLIERSIPDMSDLDLPDLEF